MASIWKTSVSICAIAALGGCLGMTRPIPLAADPSPDLARIREEIRAACLASPTPGDAARAEGGLMARNRLVTAYMAAVDVAYHDYERRLLDSVRSGDDVGASMETLGLAANSGPIGDDALARSLTTTSGAVAGTRAVVGRDYLLDVAIGVLQTQMRANRATQRAIILERLRLPLADWATCVALSDVLAYEQAGTLNAALAALAASAAEANEEGEAREERAIAGDRP